MQSFIWLILVVVCLLCDVLCYMLYDFSLLKGVKQNMKKFINKVIYRVLGVSIKLPPYL